MECVESLYLLQSTHFSQVKIELPCSGVTNHQDLIPSKVDLLRQLDGLEHGEDGGELPEFQHLEDLEDLDLIILILRRKIQKEIWELKSNHEMQWIC